MKKYIISCSAEDIKVNKKFRSRNKAVNYMFNKILKNTELEYENIISKHNIEYICKNHFRFNVSRISA